MGVLFKHQHWKTLKHGFPTLMPRLNTSYHMMTPVPYALPMQTLAHLNPFYHEGMMYSCGGGVHWYSPLANLDISWHIHNIFVVVLLLRTVNTVLVL